MRRPPSSHAGPRRRAAGRSRRRRPPPRGARRRRRGPCRACSRRRQSSSAAVAGLRLQGEDALARRRQRTAPGRAGGPGSPSARCGGRGGASPAPARITPPAPARATCAAGCRRCRGRRDPRSGAARRICDAAAQRAGEHGGAARQPVEVAASSETSTSRGSARSGKAATTSPGASSTGRSLRLCTARSRLPSRRPRSSSSVNSPLPPSLREVAAGAVAAGHDGTSSTVAARVERSRAAATHAGLGQGEGGSAGPQAERAGGGGSSVGRRLGSARRLRRRGLEQLAHQVEPRRPRPRRRGRAAGCSGGGGSCAPGRGSGGRGRRGSPRGSGRAPPRPPAAASPRPASGGGRPAAPPRARGYQRAKRPSSCSTISSTRGTSSRRRLRLRWIRLSSESIVWRKTLPSRAAAGSMLRGTPRSTASSGRPGAAGQRLGDAGRGSAPAPRPPVVATTTSAAAARRSARRGRAARRSGKSRAAAPRRARACGWRPDLAGAAARSGCGPPCRAVSPAPTTRTRASSRSLKMLRASSTAA